MMHDFLGFGVMHTVLAEEFLGGETQGDRAGIADRFFGVLQHFAQQPDAVFQRAAVIIGALVAPALQEMHGQ